MDIIEFRPTRFGDSEFDELIGPIALYPESLFAKVLAASKHWDQIPAAAQWAKDNGDLKGEALVEATQKRNFDWDPSIVSLLLFAPVLDMMASNMRWTKQLGNALRSTPTRG